MESRKTPKDSKCAGRTVAPNEGKRTPGIDGEPSRTFTGITVGAVARLRHGLWRAECVTKDACSVRGGATGDRGLRGPTAPVVYSTQERGCDIFLLPQPSEKARYWQTVYVVFMTILRAINPDLVAAYCLCKRKAFLLLRGDTGDTPHEYVRLLDAYAVKSLSTYLDSLKATGFQVCQGLDEVTAINADVLANMVLSAPLGMCLFLS